jgi:hypothetical protein
MNKIQWLNVPYGEKHEAKNLGCRWDAHFRKWWKPESVSIETIPKQWLINKTSPIKDKDGTTTTIRTRKA